jgi:predicted ATPase
MSHLTHFGVGNFKVFNELTDFELAPITILTGKNNSGKSSLIKALKLFLDDKRSSLFRPSERHFYSLDFKQQDLKLGMPNDFINFNDNTDEELEKTIEFQIPFSNLLFPNGILNIWYTVNKERETLVRIGAIIRNDKQRVFKYLPSSLIGDGKYKYTLEVNFKYLIDTFNSLQDDELTLFLRAKLSIPTNSPLMQRLTEVHKNKDHRIILDLHKYQKENIYSPGFLRLGERINLPLEELNQLNDFILIDFLNISGVRNLFEPDSTFTQESFPSSSVFTISGYQEVYRLFQEFINFDGKYNDQIDKLSNTNVPPISVSFHPVFYILKRILELISENINIQREIAGYLPSIRAKNERLYIVSKEGYAIQEFDQKTFNGIDFSEKTINEFYSQVLKDFEIGDKIEVKTYQQTATEIRIVRNGKEMLLSDLGFGYAQLIPIILKILVTASKTKLSWRYKVEKLPFSKIIIEEPESNLHPDFQAKLADMFVKASNLFGIQFIIETHSEYLIRRLQYLTAKKDIKPEDISIYYFNNPKHEDVISGKANQVEKIMFDKHGRLNKEFGSGFFDEADNIATELFLLSHTQSN